MSDSPLKDVVIDTNVMRLYDKPKDPIFIAFFHWLRTRGTLTASRKLISEYGGTQDLIFVLINELARCGRYNLVSNAKIREFTQDRHFNYTCNPRDIPHVRLVLVSHRKRLIAFDKRLKNDVNSSPKVDGLKPCACSQPRKCCCN